MQSREVMRMSKRMVVRFAIIFCGVFSIGYTNSAQQKPKPGADDPVELATIVIQGTEAVDIPGGTKQPPRKTKSLTKDRLDSLNTLEKHTAIRLPSIPLPETSLEKPMHKGFIKGELGQFLTPLLDAGYGFAIGGYRMELNGGLEASNGHVTNAQFNNFNVSLDAEYVAPEKFIFFGGSKTQSFIRLKRDAHNLYAVQSAAHRSLTDFSIGLRTDGSYNGYTYSLGGDWGAGSVMQQGSDAVNNILHGFVGATKKFNDIVIGAEANLQFHTLHGKGLNMMDFLASGVYVDHQYLVKVKSGLQSYTNAEGATFGAFKVFVDGDYFLSENFTVGGYVHSGLLGNSFIQQMRLNPYISNTLSIEYARENIGVGARLWYHPLERMSVMAKGSFGSLGNYAVWNGNSDATFGLKYLNVSRIEVETELSYTLDNNNILNANVQARSVSSKENDMLPYISPFQTSIRWDRTWTDKFGSQLTATYFATRSTGNSSNPQLSGYIDVSLLGTYTISSNLKAHIRIDNILNSTIYVWDGYKERGIFFAGGVLWTL